MRILVVFLLKLWYYIKEVKMSKEKKLPLEAVVEKIETKPDTKPEPVLNLTAFGIAKHPITGLWHVTNIKYDTDGNVGKIEYREQGDMKSIVFERFQINVANELFRYD